MRDRAPGIGNLRCDESIPARYLKATNNVLNVPYLFVSLSLPAARFLVVAAVGASETVFDRRLRPENCYVKDNRLDSKDSAFSSIEHLVVVACRR